MHGLQLRMVLGQPGYVCCVLVSVRVVCVSTSVCVYFCVCAHVRAHMGAHVRVQAYVRASLTRF